jgi:phosphoribosylanthranilate isomerase
MNLNNYATMRIKICGITNLNDALLCQSLGADAIGFIFFPGSKRYLPPEQVEEIVDQVSPLLLKIGVFVNEKPDTVNHIIRTCRLHGAQLHGDEPPHYIQDIHYPVIKAFRIDNQFDFSVIATYKNCSFLLDTYSPDVYGGSGASFDWECIPAGLRSACMLAGGISAANIRQVIQKVKPAGVDLSSAVESSPGKKDPEKLKAFFKQVDRLRSKYY